MEKKHQINFWYVAAAMLVLFLFQSWWAERQTVELLAYSEFVELLNAGQIEEVTVRDTVFEGRLKQPTPEGRQYFITTRVDPEIAESLAEHNVTFRGVVQNTLVAQLLSWLLPIAFFFIIWMYLIRGIAERQGLGGMMSVGKSKAKVYVERDTKVTFDDVAGVDEAKVELQEVVAFLRDPDRYGRLGARIPKGIMLVGPPGTGKTLLARAIAGEAAVPFFSISGSEFVEMFVGVGAARVRDLFDQARKAKPCIIFIDELDALGRARGVGPMGGGHDEKEQTLNQLLAELDGFDPREGIVLLAATNRPEILDAALTRAGRFDRQVVVDRPDRTGRLAILKVHVDKVALADGVDLDQIAGLTPGFTGADLANLVNEAALIATRRSGTAVSLENFTEAVERIVAGLEKTSRILNPHEREVVAYHEMGHALVAASLKGTDPVHKVSIIPRGIGALGYTLQRPTEDRFLVTREELLNKMAVLMGGRAAEIVKFGEISTGAADDLDKATDIARQMVTRYGMSEALGQSVTRTQRGAFLGNDQYGIVEPRDHSDETAREIDQAVRQLVNDALETAKATLIDRRQDLDAGAGLLLDQETINAQDFPPISSSSESEIKPAAE